MHAFTPSLRHDLSTPRAGHVSWTESANECQWSSPRRYETVITATPQGEPGASATGGRPLPNGDNGNSQRRAGRVSDRRPAVAKR